MMAYHCTMEDMFLAVLAALEVDCSSSAFILLSHKCHVLGPGEPTCSRPGAGSQSRSSSALLKFASTISPRWLPFFNLNKFGCPPSHLKKSRINSYFQSLLHLDHSSMLPCIYVVLAPSASDYAFVQNGDKGHCAGAKVPYIRCSCTRRCVSIALLMKMSFTGAVVLCISK
jgi:hypothetical protein